MRRNPNDSAVSPVIAVILMVAITVVLAATVWVWVGSFSGSEGAAPGALSITSNGVQSPQFEKNYTITSASSGLRYETLRLSVEGTAYTQDAVSAASDGEWTVYRGTTILSGTDIVTAGDRIEVDGASDMSGMMLRIVDANANSLLLQTRI